MSISDPLPLRRRALQLLSLLPVLWSAPVQPTEPAPRWVVWYSEPAGIQQTLVAELRQRLASLLPIEFLPLQAQHFPSVEPRVTAQVVLGARTLREWVALKSSMPLTLANAPVMSALIPRAAEQQLAPELPAGSSAIWLDQPPERFTALIAQAFPRLNRVGVLLGPSHSFWLPGLEAATNRDQLTLVRSPVLTEARSLFPALAAVLGDSDMLLAQPDSLLFNNETLQNVLIATYRQRVPMVTFSESHVRAGAMLGLFTSPQDVAIQVADAIQGWSVVQRWPSRAFASVGRVAINPQVARSLGIDLPSVDELEAALQRRRP